MRPELIVAEKEFRDYISSKTFLVILAIFMLLAVYGMATGMDAYNQRIEQYKQNKALDQPWQKETISLMQKQIEEAENRGASQAEIDSLRNNLEYYMNPPMPSILEVFLSMIILFTVLGMVLSVSMGFNQITKEKEDGSLKTVLSGPVYRDALINGKAIGAMVTLAIIMGTTFLITIAIMLFYGIVPGLDDILRIIAFFVAGLLYCAAFFALAMMVSTIAKNTAMSVLLTIGLIFLMLVISILSFFISNEIAGLIMGPPPEVQPYIPTPVPIKAGDNASTTSPIPIANAPMPVYYNTEYQDYYTKRSRLSMEIADTLNMISPISDFSGLFANKGIAGVILSNKKPGDYGIAGIYPYTSNTISLWESLSYVWTKVLSLIIITVVAFAISYMKFMRMDIR